MKFAILVVIALLCLGDFAQADVFNLGPGLVKLETVTVGDAGNVADTNGYGSVNYSYNIGKYEVTAGQYTDFLNAKAGFDAYDLYNVNMDKSVNSYGCNIKRTAVNNSWLYTVAADYANRPVNFVSFWDACRFTNWLSNGQGNGDTETGSYALNGYKGTDGRNIIRSSDWKWAVPSENEWYKAAYYKSDGTDAGYWDYPTGSDTAPGHDISDLFGNNANYSSGSYVIGSPYYRSEVGEFQNSDSSYGTFDQGGNVYEWNEAIDVSKRRGLRGGAFSSGSNILYAHTSQRDVSNSSYEYISTGFRVVQAVPEPSSLLALAGLLAPLGLICRRRKH